ncbi:MAG: dTMP kinase [Holosporales bacterium]|nr:dTMP kinase [Holosporales bacterium]
MSKKGVFITFEGGEGSGKSTQSRLLANRLVLDGFDVVLTREPGGTDGAERIRDLVLTGSADKWGALTEALLYLAARSDHWERVIKPAIDAGKVVISDRFHDSSIIYQGHVKGVPTDFLDFVYKIITGGVVPDRTYLIVTDPQIGLQRSINNHNNKETRFEQMGVEFHRLVLNNFLKLAKQNDRFAVIDGSRSISSIQNDILMDFGQIFVEIV